ncbi:MAG TPA: hypothetical protein VMG36_05105 [Thermoplasmata archaeon]|nr:hypothetical protein [Thermoplasmata archaeon]
MTGVRDGHGLGRLALAAAVVTVLLTTVLASGSVGAAALRPSSPTAYPALAWTNGKVLCVTDPTLPSATVTASGVAGAGIEMGVGNITQENLLGVAAATADLTSASWTATNLSDTATYAVRYTASVPVTETALLGIVGVQIGTVQVAVTIALANSSVNAAPASDAYDVSMELNISDWPWVASVGAGPLVADLSVAPASTAVVHLTVGTGNATVAAVNATGSTMAYLSMAAAANVTSSGGVTSSIAVLGQLLSMAVAQAIVEVNFTTAATGASDMTYTSDAVVVPAIVIGPPPPNLKLPGVAPIPTVDFLAVGGAAVLASLAIAGGARRARRSPSNLEYVTEEEQA